MAQGDRRAAGRARVGTLVAAVMVALIAGACTPTTPAPGAWAPMAVPASGADPGVRQVVYGSVACTGPTMCVALGGTGDDGLEPLRLARRWDGQAWRPFEVPPWLSSLTCGAPNWCHGLGASGTTWTYDGSEWVSRPINPSVTVNRLSCAGPTLCLAIGFTQDLPPVFEPPLPSLARVLRWDGSTWSDVSPPGWTFGTSPQSVACTPRTTTCTVLTADGTTAWLDRWDDSGWTRLPPAPVPPGAKPGPTMHCPAADACVLIGLQGWSGEAVPAEQGDVLLWEHGGWSRVRVVTGPFEQVSAYPVDCPSTTTCTGRISVTRAGGAREELLLRRQGATWSTTPITATRPGPLHGLSCPTERFCATVGSDPIDPRPGEPVTALLAVGDGDTWQVDRSTPNPPARASEALNDVTCATTRTPAQGAADAWCVAVGSARLRGREHSLTDVWDGTRWQVTTRFGAEGDDVTLLGVSCPAVRRCVAVGRRRTLDGVVSPVLRTGDGTAWTDVDIAATRAPVTGELTHVSCTAPTFCLAAGSGDPGIALITDGTAWRSVPPPPKSSWGGVRDLSCLSGVRCLAAQTNALPLAWNGSAWREITALAGGAPIASFTTVDCTPGLTCRAFGHIWRPPGPWPVTPGFPVPAFLQGDGVTMTLTAGPASVSAESMACDATGRCLTTSPTVREASGPDTPAKAARWTGLAWQPTAAPAQQTRHHDDFGDAAPGLACVPGWCVAVNTVAAPGLPPRTSGDRSPTVAVAEAYTG